MKTFKTISTLLAIALITFFAACKKTNVSPVVIVASNPLVDSLVACYKFNNDFNDSTGKNIAGVSSGAVSFTTDRKGNSNGAINFGTSAKLTLSGIKINNPNSVTMAYWIKPVTSGSGLQYYIISNQFLGIAAAQSGNSFSGTVSIPATNSAFATISDNNWHHLATTYDGIQINVYLDGILVAITSHPGTITNTAYDYVIGYFNNSYWQGNIDELRIYKTALTGSQIFQLYKL